MEMNAPIQIEMKVHAINEDTEQQAVVTMSAPLGQYPTRETLVSLYEAAKNALPDGYRAMNKSEFFNAYLQEEYGTTEKFATPGSSDFTDEVIETSQEVGE